jgi:hypothetical protein
MDDADDEVERVDAEPCPSGLFIMSSLDASMLRSHMEPSSLAGSVLIAIGRDDEQRRRLDHIVHDEYAHTRRPSPAASSRLAAPIGEGDGITPLSLEWGQRPIRRRACMMAATYRLSRWRRLLTGLVRILLRVGLGPRHTYLLTVRGRRSGVLYSTPITLVEASGQRWFVAPYGEVAWVRNA